MSLIARCPACGTLFRVVPDQLKISDGWVRCGQCAEVFDANQSLQQLESPVPAGPAPVDTGSPPQPEAERLVEAAEGADASEATLQADAPDAAQSPQQADDPETAPAPDVPDPHEVREPELGEPVLAPDPLEPAPADPVVGPAVDPLADPVASYQDPVEVGAEPLRPPQQDVSFVRQARRRAFWQSRGVRLTLAGLAVAFTLTLIGQAAYHQRDRLASQVPALQPVLAALCEALQCRLGPPRHIESIAIESSAFTRLRPDAFRLQLTLNNQADIALAVPALELTLTDLQDQPVLRRVLQPADLGPDTPAAIASRAEWSSTLTLTIAAGVDPTRIVGYRVLAFYP